MAFQLTHEFGNRDPNLRTWLGERVQVIQVKVIRAEVDIGIGTNPSVKVSFCEFVMIQQ